MNKQILIVRTKDDKYAKVIAKKINSLGTECCGIVYYEKLDVFLKQKNCTPETTLLHYRTANPDSIRIARELEKKGYHSINPTRVLDLTSDKWKSYEWAHQYGIDLPLTKKDTKDNIKHLINELTFQKFVIKPINSEGQGIYCFKSSIDDPEVDYKLSQVPGKKIILQEFVEYLRIYRVIIIGNKALDRAVFYDKPNSTRWKVSVCLNPKMKLDRNPDPKLLSYAKHLAAIFGSEIAFIDIYETKNGYVLSEINTACNLTLHEQKSGYSISEDIAKYLIKSAQQQ